MRRSVACDQRGCATSGLTLAKKPYSLGAAAIHSETGIFVPVWLHGVEAGGLNAVPQYLDSEDDGVCTYDVARGMYNGGFNQTQVQARTLPFEAHLFQVVGDVLLPEWRASCLTTELSTT